MMLKLTKKERNRFKRIADKLYRNGVEDEHKAVVFYRRMSKELREAGLYTEADALEIIADSEEVHKDILNEIIKDIEEKIIVSQFKKETTLDKPRFTLMGSKRSLLDTRR